MYTHHGIDSKGGGPPLSIWEKSPENSRKIKSIPNEKRSGMAPKKNENHANPRYPNKPLPQRA